MLDFIKQAFSDGGTASSSRIISFICTLAVIAWITHVVCHSHALPDAITMGGATAFSTSHYIANRVTTAFATNKVIQN